MTSKEKSFDDRRRIARWVALRIMPHEARTRGWLRRRVSHEEADEVIQDAYCRLAMLDDVSHIERPDAYFFSMVRNLLVRRLKRQRVVPLELVAEIDAFSDKCWPSPEDIVGARRDYARVLQIIGTLPERCQRIVELRKIEGWSQREIADHLGTTEKAVEKQVWLGIKAIRAAWSDLSIPDESRDVARRSMERDQ